VVDWLNRSAAAIEDIQHRQKKPLITGGTGFYFKALFEGLNPPAGTTPKTRQQVKEEIERLGREKIYEKLKTIDPEAAARLHPNDLKRISRALEVFYSTGRPLSQQQKKIKLPYEFEIIGLTRPRADLYRRIEERVDWMIANGLIDEVKNLLARGYHRHLQSMQALGYKETIDFLDGLLSKEEYVNLLKKKTRHFAKRQLTWFRKLGDRHLCPLSNVMWLPNTYHSGTS
jgi:tRNA dimethylallyltransferase